MKDLKQKTHFKLEHVAINDVLPLKAACCDATAILNVSGTQGQQRPNFDGFISIHYAMPPYLARIRNVCLFPFGKVWLGSVCHVQRLATKQSEEFTEGG